MARVSSRSASDRQPTTQPLSEQKVRAVAQAQALSAKVNGWAILFQVIMVYTVYGKRSYAIGSNEATARRNAVPIFSKMAGDGIS